jgi:hypothetical protein
MDERISELKERIAALMRVAETGEQWAEICALADEVVALGGRV